MKTKSLLMAAALLIAGTCQAQFFNRLADRAADAAKTAVERNVEKRVEEGVDKAMDPDTYKQMSEKQKEKKASQQEAENQVAEGWTCSACGHQGNDGKFCGECGAKKPEANGAWTCSECGHTGNTGKFCSECGTGKETKTAKAQEGSNFTITYIKEDQYNSDEWTTDARYYASDDEWECYELYIGLNIPKVEIGKVYTAADAYAVYVLDPRGADRHDFVEFTLKFGPNHSFELSGLAVDQDTSKGETTSYRVKATYKGTK